MGKQRKPRQPDPNVTAKGMIDALAAKSEGREVPKPPEPPKKNPAAVELGRLGGLKGGKARAKKLTKEERSDIAKKAALSRWAERRQDGPNQSSSS